MPREYVLNLTQNHLPVSVGSKAQYLRDLMDRGYQVPMTRVCTWEAYSRFVKDDFLVLHEIEQELTKKIDLKKAYAVRSSGNIEDNLNHSFAGQFKSFLNIQGVEDTIIAMKEIWETAQSPEVNAYLEKTQAKEPELLMAVVLQEMVTPIISGVSFSKNPITGLDEIIVEAIQGSGTAIVQDGATPDRWIHKWGEWISTPENTTIDQDLIAQVVEQTKSIANSFGRPVDLEWVYDGKIIYWLQLREISSLEGIDLYSNKIAQEVLPGMIKPLIWSVNVPLVNGAWVRLFTEMIGPNDIDPLSLAKSFYYRAYFNMGAIGQILELVGMPRETLELMIGVEAGGSERPRFKPSTKTYRLLPRMLLFALDMLRKSREIEQFLAKMKSAYLAVPVDQADQMEEDQLLEQIDQLYTLTQESAYFNIVTPLLMQLYNGMLKNRLEKLGVDYASFDLTHDFKQWREVDPNYHLDQLARMYRELKPEQRSLIGECSYEDFMQIPDCEDIQREFQQFISQFGHLSDSGNDFSYVPWRENPDVILSMITTESRTEQKGIKKTRFEDLHPPLLDKLWLSPIYHRARKYFLYREQIGSLYTFGYGLFRKFFLSLGEHFRKRGLLNTPDDIFYLSFEEVRHSVLSADEQTSHVEIVKERKKEMDDYRDITPPTTIYGDQPLPLEEPSGNILVGTPTSRGYYRGPARIIRGIEDGQRIDSGDVLVVPYSDVGWTPMFTKAGAVVAESGGMLSHSSIVAREYGIPAVVSVTGACKLLDSRVVTVDGFRGKVIIHD